MDKTTTILQSVSSLRHYTQAARANGLRIAFVPTMGALHEGHLDLVRHGLRQVDRVIVSIFVNPTQFGPNEDFTAYPRTWEDDLAKLNSVGAHAIFHPAVPDMYPPGFATTVSVDGISTTLEGAHRPGHFNGVATVVTKLLLQVLPDIALFGEKDYQQLQVIKRLTVDLDIPVNIIGVPTVRDEHGLALSSRNIYLSAEQRDIARKLNKILHDAANEARAGKSPDGIEQAAAIRLTESGFESIDYIAVRDAHTLQPPSSETKSLRVLAAVRIGRTRLIDNVPV